MQRTVDVTTARRQFGTLLDEVFYKGDVNTIIRKGKPPAHLVRATAASHDHAQTPLDSERQCLIIQLPGLPKLSMNEDERDV